MNLIEAWNKAEEGQKIRCKLRGVIIHECIKNTEKVTEIIDNVLKNPLKAVPTNFLLLNNGWDVV